MIPIVMITAMMKSRSVWVFISLADADALVRRPIPGDVRAAQRFAVETLPLAEIATARGEQHGRRRQNELSHWSLLAQSTNRR